MLMTTLGIWGAVGTANSKQLPLIKAMVIITERVFRIHDTSQHLEIMNTCISYYFLFVVHNYYNTLVQENCQKDNIMFHGFIPTSPGVNHAMVAPSRESVPQE